MLNLIKYRSGYSVLADGYLAVCELKRCSVARAKFFVSSAERWEPTHCNQMLILQPLLLAAHYWINSEFTAKAESLCMCVFIHLGCDYVCTPRWLWRSQTWARAGKTKSQGEKTKDQFGFFHVEELPIKQNFKENREKPKANFIYLLQRHRGRSDSVKAAYGVWRVCTPFWEGCISLCRYSS